jgi:nitrite reductase/ring-hydroxylating ferredoxin subunit
MWITACDEGDLAPGGVKYVRSGDAEIAVCRVAAADGVAAGYYAVGRRCGHMNAPLEQGALDGPYLTCPLHQVRFDVRTGTALNNPIDHDYGDERPPEPYRRLGRTQMRLEWKIRVHDLPTYRVRVKDGIIELEVPDTAT